MIKDKNALIIDSYYRNTINIPWIKALRFEKDIIKGIIKKNTTSEQLNAIKKILSQFINLVELVKSRVEGTDQIYIDDLREELERENIIISENLLYMIKEFISRQISQELAKRLKDKVEDFLSTL